MRRSEPPVRYDDSVFTLLSLASTAEGAAVDAHFSNLLDLLAQNKPSTRGDIRAEIIVDLQNMATEASATARQRAAWHVSRLPVALPADLASLLVQITHGASRPWLDHARLTPQAWSTILPQLAMHEVRQVAARNDLPVGIALQLGPIKPSLLLLPAPLYVTVSDIEEASDDVLELAPPQITPANDAEPLPAVAVLSGEADASSQVKTLLERIADFRKRLVAVPDEVPALDEQHILAEAVESPASASESLFLLENPLAYVPAPPAPEDVPLEPTTSAPPPQVDLPALLADWFWETDRDGVFCFAGQNANDKMLPAGALPSLKGQHLLDWLEHSPQRTKAQTALSRRTAFHQIALHVEDGAFAGDWLLSAVAAFDAKNGMFLGHRGVAQRQPRRSEAATEAVSDALATAVHETRTPLNAIMGFAQMIEAQPFGPVSPAYTAQADAILDASSRLLRALDDVSESSRLDRGIATMQDHGFSLEALLESLFAQMQSTALRRNVRFHLHMADGVPSLWSDRDIVERCIGRLAIALMSVAASGETINVLVRDSSLDHVCVVFSRPTLLRNLADAELMKPVQSADNDTPRLNIGFALRLVERLAAVVGGHLRLGVATIDLLLPAVPMLAANRDTGASDMAAR
jgi:nitrogen-specific signal transduction histidine kinase